MFPVATHNTIQFSWAVSFVPGRERPAFLTGNLMTFHPDMWDFPPRKISVIKSTQKAFYTGTPPPPPPVTGFSSAWNTNPIGGDYTVQYRQPVGARMPPPSMFWSCTPSPLPSPPARCPVPQAQLINLPCISWSWNFWGHNPWRSYGPVDIPLIDNQNYLGRIQEVAPGWASHYDIIQMLLDVGGGPPRSCVISIPQLCDLWMRYLE